MTKYLPPKLLAMFDPRPPVEYLPPITRKKLPPPSGLAAELELVRQNKVNIDVPEDSSTTDFSPLYIEKRKAQGVVPVEDLHAYEEAAKKAKSFEEITEKLSTCT